MEGLGCGDQPVSPDVRIQDGGNVEGGYILDVDLASCMEAGVSTSTL